MIHDSIPKQLFITGTDTDVGKTVVSAVLVAGLRAAYWKPIQCGLDSITDTQWIAKHTGLPSSHFYPERYRLSAPLSPHASAAREHISIKMEAFKLPQTSSSSHLVVEGAGGILVPLNNTMFMVDLMKKLQLPVLLVASSQLGTINHTLLSLDQLRKHQLEICGVVINGPINKSNKEAIERFGNVKILAEVDYMPSITPATLTRCFENQFTLN